MDGLKGQVVCAVIKTALVGLKTYTTQVNTHILTRETPLAIRMMNEGFYEDMM